MHRRQRKPMNPDQQRGGAWASGLTTPGLSGGVKLYNPAEFGANVPATDSNQGWEQPQQWGIPTSQPTSTAWGSSSSDNSVWNWSSQPSWPHHHHQQPQQQHPPQMQYPVTPQDPYPTNSYMQYSVPSETPTAYTTSSSVANGQSDPWQWGGDGGAPGSEVYGNGGDYSGYQHQHTHAYQQPQQSYENPKREDRASGDGSDAPADHQQGVGVVASVQSPVSTAVTHSQDMSVANTSSVNSDGQYMMHNYYQFEESFNNVGGSQAYDVNPVQHQQHQQQTHFSGWDGHTVDGHPQSQHNQQQQQQPPQQMQPEGKEYPTISSQNDNVGFGMFYSRDDVEEEAHTEAHGSACKPLENQQPVAVEELPVTINPSPSTLEKEANLITFDVKTSGQKETTDICVAQMDVISQDVVTSQPNLQLHIADGKEPEQLIQKDESPQLRENKGEDILPATSPVVPILGPNGSQVRESSGEGCEFKQEEDRKNTKEANNPGQDDINQEVVPPEHHHQEVDSSTQDTPHRDVMGHLPNLPSFHARESSPFQPVLQHQPQQQLPTPLPAQQQPRREASVIQEEMVSRNAPRAPAISPVDGANLEMTPDNKERPDVDGQDEGIASYKRSGDSTQAWGYGNFVQQPENLEVAPKTTKPKLTTLRPKDSTPEEPPRLAISTSSAPPPLPSPATDRNQFLETGKLLGAMDELPTSAATAATTPTGAQPRQSLEPPSGRQSEPPPPAFRRLVPGESRTQTTQQTLSQQVPLAKNSGEVPSEHAPLEPRIVTGEGVREEVGLVTTVTTSAGEGMVEGMIGEERSETIGSDNTEEMPYPVVKKEEEKGRKQPPLQPQQQPPPRLRGDSDNSDNNSPSSTDKDDLPTHRRLDPRMEGGGGRRGEDWNYFSREGSPNERRRGGRMKEEEWRERQRDRDRRVGGGRRRHSREEDRRRDRQEDDDDDEEEEMVERRLASHRERGYREEWEMYRADNERGGRGGRRDRDRERESPGLRDWRRDTREDFHRGGYGDDLSYRERQRSQTPSRIGSEYDRPPSRTQSAAGYESDRDERYFQDRYGRPDLRGGRMSHLEMRDQRDPRDVRDPRDSRNYPSGYYPALKPENSCLPSPSKSGTQPLAKEADARNRYDSYYNQRNYYDAYRQYYNNYPYAKYQYQYYDELYRKNPQAYTEMYNKYYESQQEGFNDERTSVHSGRSSVNEERFLQHAEFQMTGEQPVRPSSSQKGYGDNYDYSSISYGESSTSGLQESRPEIPLARHTPVKFPSAHVLGVLSAGGQLIRVLPNNPLEGQPATIELHSLQTLMEHCPDFQELKEFPGPLVRGTTHKRSVIDFCKMKIQKSTSQVDLVDREGYVLLWELLILMLIQNGMVMGTDIAELLLREHEYCEHSDKSSTASEITPTEMNPRRENSTSATTTVVSCSSHINHNPSSAQDSVVVRFRELLLLGHKKDALEWAMKNGLWGHALFLASKMDQRTYGSVLARFANGLPLNDPLQTLYQLMSGRQPAAVMCCAEEKWGDWQPHLAMILANPSQKSELDRKSIVTLGDTLAARGCLFSSHLCYLVAQVDFGTYSNKASKMVLLGSSHSLPLANFATNEAIQWTEVYEYVRQLADSDWIFVNFQSYKFLYAGRLAEYGFAQEALQYCEAISNIVLHQPSAFSPSLLGQLEELSSRLKLHDPTQYLDTEEESAASQDPEWLQRLQNLKLGDDAQASVAEQQRENVDAELVADVADGAAVAAPMPESGETVNTTTSITGDYNQEWQQYYYQTQQQQIAEGAGEQRDIAGSNTYLPPVAEDNERMSGTNSTALATPSVDPLVDYNSYGQSYGNQWDSTGGQYGGAQEHTAEFSGSEMGGSGGFNYWDAAVHTKQANEPPPKPAVGSGEQEKKATGEGNKEEKGKKQASGKGGASGSVSNNGSGWLGGLWNKLSLRPKNQMILPDDSNPSEVHGQKSADILPSAEKTEEIVWDPDTKKWVNLNKDDSESPGGGPVAPPTDLDLMGKGSGTAGLLMTNSPVGNHAPPGGPITSTPSKSAPPGPPGPSFPMDAPSSFGPNKYKKPKGLSMRQNYVDIMNPTSNHSTPLMQPGAAPVAPTANYMLPNAPDSMTAAGSQVQENSQVGNHIEPSMSATSTPLMFNPAQFSSQSQQPSKHQGLRHYRR